MTRPMWTEAFVWAHGVRAGGEKCRVLRYRGRLHFPKESPPSDSSRKISKTHKNLNYSSYLYDVFVFVCVRHKNKFVFVHF